MKKKPLGLLLAIAGGAMVLGAGSLIATSEYVGAEATVAAEFPGYVRIDNIEQLKAYGADAKFVLGNIEEESVSVFQGSGKSYLTDIGCFSSITNWGNVGYTADSWMEFTIEWQNDTFAMKDSKSGDYVSFDSGKNGISMGDVKYFTLAPGYTGASYDAGYTFPLLMGESKYPLVLNFSGDTGSGRVYKGFSSVGSGTKLKANHAPVFLYAIPVVTTPVVKINADSDYISMAAGVDATLTATANNFSAEVTYEWSLATDGEELAKITPNGATATLEALKDANGEVTANVTATAGSETANASIAINVLKLMTPEEVNKDATDGDYVLVAGYIVTENSRFGGWSQHELAAATLDAAPDNGTTSIALFSNQVDPKYILGEYVVVYGEFTIYNGTYEINTGYEILSRETGAARLADFILGAETDDQCTVKYEIAKAHYLGMSDEEKTTFKTSADTTIAAARERYEAWASAMGDTNAYEATTGAFNGNFGNDGMTYTIIALSSLLVISLAGVAVYFAIRKKKANKA